MADEVIFHNLKQTYNFEQCTLSDLNYWSFLNIAKAQDLLNDILNVFSF